MRCICPSCSNGSDRSREARAEGGGHFRIKGILSISSELNGDARIDRASDEWRVGQPALKTRALAPHGDRLASGAPLGRMLAHAFVARAWTIRARRRAASSSSSARACQSARCVRRYGVPWCLWASGWAHRSSSTSRAQAHAHAHAHAEVAKADEGACAAPA
jgi:hypothetical protein